MNTLNSNIINTQRKGNGSAQIDIDGDVEDERRHVLRLNPNKESEYAVVLKGLTKDYGDNKVVVNDIWLTIPKGQLFGLLGVNGAGKSTTFNMMTKTTRISGGKAIINGFDIETDTSKVFENLGYCPQTDNLVDYMTCLQTLEFYAKLKGIKPYEYRQREVLKIIHDLQLTDFKNVFTMKLSGGNKRKLCTAIALIGNPEIVFLDEPTCGLDPIARRESWKIMEAHVKAGNTIILTSHSMEECESLCERLVIMVKGRFVCLGSPQHLKNRFGNTYILKVQLTYEYTDESKVKLVSLILKMVEGTTCDSAYHASLNFSLPRRNITWASMFQMMQDIKNNADNHIQDYSLAQTSLEKIFTTFAENQ